MNSPALRAARDNPDALPLPGASGQVPRPLKARVLRWLPPRWIRYTGDRRQRTLHLTFDDGPNAEHTPMMLDLLASLGVRATFFVVGEDAEQQAALVRRIVEEGHALGNHSWSHPRFDRIRLAHQRTEIDRTDALLQGFDGLARHPFRPPHGIIPLRLALDCVRRQVPLVHWSYDSLDYTRGEPAELAAIMRRHPVEPGEIVLMHDDSLHSHALVKALVPEWQASGFSFAVLDTATTGFTGVSAT